MNGEYRRRGLHMIRNIFTLKHEPATKISVESRTIQLKIGRRKRERGSIWSAL